MSFLLILVGISAPVVFMIICACILSGEVSEAEEHVVSITESDAAHCTNSKEYGEMITPANLEDIEVKE